jgi:hypothetical protein
MDRARLYDRRNLPKRQPVNRHALLSESVLKFRSWKNAVIPRQRDNFELGMTAAELFHLTKIIELIGRDAKRAVLLERRGD